MNASNEDTGLSEDEGIKRLREKAQDMKGKQQVVSLSVDEDEPTGLLSGGPEHLDLEEENRGK